MFAVSGHVNSLKDGEREPFSDSLVKGTSLTRFQKALPPDLFDGLENAGRVVVLYGRLDERSGWPPRRAAVARDLDLHMRARASRA